MGYRPFIKRGRQLLPGWTKGILHKFSIEDLASNLIEISILHDFGPG